MKEIKYDETIRGRVLPPPHGPGTPPPLADATAGAKKSSLSWEAKRNIALGTIILSGLTCGILAFAR